MRGVALPLRLMAGGRVGRLVALMACALLAALAHPAVAPAKRGLVTGFADGARYESGNPTERATWLDRTVEARAGIVRLDLSWRGVAASQRPTDPTNPGSASYDFSRIDAAVRDAEARGLIVLLLVNSAPAWAEGPEPTGLVPPRNLEAEPLRPRRLHAGGRLTLLGWIRPGWRRPGTAAPCRAGAAIWAEPNL